MRPCPAETCPRFTGNSVVVPFKGERRLRIPRLGETYVLTVANLVYRGLLFGARGAECGGGGDRTGGRREAIGGASHQSKVSLFVFVRHHH